MNFIDNQNIDTVNRHQHSINAPHNFNEVNYRSHIEKSKVNNKCQQSFEVLCGPRYLSGICYCLCFLYMASAADLIKIVRCIDCMLASLLKGLTLLYAIQIKRKLVGVGFKNGCFYLCYIDFFLIKTKAVL